jgi:hypothetical protein
MLGRLLTEHPGMELAGRFSLFNRKPFNCRPCLTFHLIWSMQAAAAMWLKSFAFFAAGLSCAVVIFMILYIDSKNKTDE